MTSRESFRRLVIQQSQERLAALKIQFEGGDHFALMAAIRICANFDLVMPEWVARNFIRRFDRVLGCRVKSWDEAFGKPYPKGVHLKGLRRDRELRLAIWLRIREIRATELVPFPMDDPRGIRAASLFPVPLDDALFERVGKEFGIAKTKCSEIYYQAEKRFPKPTSAKS